MNSNSPLILLSGRSHFEFAQRIADELETNVSKATLSNFANGELKIEIGVSVRHADVYIIQTGYDLVNDGLMELLLMIHTCKICSANRVTAVIPCFPYSRHLFKPYSKMIKDNADSNIDNDNSFHHYPINSSPSFSPSSSFTNSYMQELYEEFNKSEKNEKEMKSEKGQEMTNMEDSPYEIWSVRSGALVANMIEAAGADRVITMDLHSPQFQGYFEIPVDNLPGLPLIIKCIKEELADCWNQLVIVSPDAGGAKRASAVANALDNVPFALIHRDKHNKMTLVGTVKNKNVLIVDDLTDTSDTLTFAGQLCFELGAKRIYAIITHGVLSGDAIKSLNASKIDRIFVSNTIPLRRNENEKDNNQRKITVFDVVPIFSETIKRNHNGESISCLFSPQAFCKSHQKRLADEDGNDCTETE